MLEKQNFHVITDHKLRVRTKKIGSNVAKTNSTTNQLLFISEFTTDVCHVSGAEKIVVNALSCVDPIVMLTSLDMQKIAEAQVSDYELQQLKQLTFEAQKFRLSETPSNIYCDISEEDRPYISESLRRRVSTW